MEKDRFRQIDTILDAVMDAPTIEREEILTAKCAGDDELKSKVLSLLDSLENSEDFIERNEFTSVKHFIENEIDDFVDKRIGSYQLKKLIGRGGMSAVYLASRIDDFDKEVAVKIIPPFENREHAAQNFRRERQILARLDHPNIARILDGGTTNGKPYIVMEFVDGLSLTDFFRTGNLETKEILRLFLKVCETVVFAHQNLIVHRDLKPNNILVTREGDIKLLDFGIAKLIDAGHFDFAENQTFEGNALTFEYASPEQINGDHITVSSDVYSLGVILYELLTGKRPHDFKNKALGEIITLTKHKEPIAPSEVADSSRAVSDSELDAIVLKALAKNVGERYATVSDLIADINNYLHDLPISARKQTAYYRFQKYFKRHRIETAAFAVFMLILFGWLITTILQSTNAKNQSEENLRKAYSAEMILAANEYEKSNLNRLREIVERYQPTEDDSQDLRGFEWYFLNNLLNPPGKIKTFPNPDEIWSAKFSPDGKYIATASNDNRVRVFDLENATSVESAEQKGAWKIAFFPDGKRFAVSSSSNSEPIVRIYETTTAKEVFTFKGHQKRVRALAVAPDGKTIASGDQGGRLIVWNPETGAEINRFELGAPQNAFEINALNFSRAGKKLAVLGNGAFQVFDTALWKSVAADKFKLLDKNAFLSGWSVEFSPLDKTIALGTFEGDVVFLDADNLQILRVVKPHQSNVKSISFSPDGKMLATASWDRTVKFISVATGDIVNELRGHFAGVHDVEFSRDGKTILTAGGDFNLNLWDSEQVGRENAMLTSARIFTFSPDGNTGFGWNISANELYSYDLVKKSVNWSVQIDLVALSLDYNEESNLVVIGEKDGYVSIINAQNGAQQQRFRPHDKTIHAIRVSNDGKLIYSAHEDGVVKALNRETGTEVFGIETGPEVLRFINQSPDGRFLVTGGNGKTVNIYDAATGNKRNILKSHKKPLYHSIFSHDGKTMVSIGSDELINIWNLPDFSFQRELSGTSGGVFAAAFSPDGKRLATASDVGIIRLWNPETGEQVLAFSAHQKQITNLKFTTDGNSLMSFDLSGKLETWNSR